jgi:hypothetical protein
MIPRPRLLPASLAAMVLLLAAKLHGLVLGLPATAPQVGLVSTAHAVSTEARPAGAMPSATAPAAAPDPLAPEQQAERAVLEGLRAHCAPVASSLIGVSRRSRHGKWCWRPLSAGLASGSRN